MRAYRVHEFGGPDSLRLDDLPEPTAGPGQVLVRVRAVSLNYRDLLVIKGHYNRNLKLPMVPLSDASGEVAAVGAGVTRWKAGDRVAGVFLQGWIEGEPTDAKAKTALGGAIEGVLAETVVFREEGLVALPEHLSFEEGATLPCAAVTAWHALFVDDPIRPGESVLVQGTGGVSIFALQFARAAGARVIVTSSHDDKLERARQLGASAVINYKTTPDWDKPARALTGDVGVDHIVEVGGSGTLARSLKAVRTGGRISVIGVLAGASGELSLIPVLMRNIRLQGIFVGSRAMFEAMNRAIVEHQIRPVVDRVFSFDEAREALRYMETGAHFGKIVVRVG
jgi:NADPH:quinone reductase-like Zn-dependent oxidoreductase